MSTDAARKGRVDEHDGRADRQRQQIVDEFAIMATDRCSGECCLEHVSAPRIDLVEDKLGASARGENGRSEEHTSELQSLMRNSYAVSGLKSKMRSKEHPSDLHSLMRIQ